MELAVFIVVLSCCLVGSAPIESGARGEVAEIEKKNFIPMRHLIKGVVLNANGQGYPTGTRQGFGLSADPCNCPPQQQMSYYQQQYQQQYQQPYFQQYQQQYYQDQSAGQTEQRNIQDYSRCPCHYPAPNGRPFYPHRPLPQLEGAPNVIDLQRLLSGRLERPPFWKARPKNPIAVKAKKFQDKPKPAAYVLPPGYGKNGFGYTGWTKTGIPKPRQQQWNNYWG